MERLTYPVATINGKRQYAAVNYQRAPGGNKQDFINALGLYEDTGLEPEEMRERVLSRNACRACPIPDGVTDDHILDLLAAENDGRLVELPCKVSDAIDTLFSHNEIIALWYDRPDDKHHSYLLWRGEAWRMPKEYGNQRVLKFKGIVSEKISESDTINLQVTPYIIPARQEAEAALEVQDG